MDDSRKPPQTPDPSSPEPSSPAPVSPESVRPEHAETAGLVPAAGTPRASESSAAPADEREIHHADGRIEHPRVRYEISDVRFRGILAILVATFCFGAIQYCVIWKVFRNREQHQATTKVSPYPLAPQPRTNLPREPRLEQIDRLAGIEGPNVFDRESASIRLLTTYGRTPDKGYIRIPIQRAMQLVVKDLPVRKQSPQSGPRKDNGLLHFGDTNSGRILRETPP